jgi:aminoglycoside 2''-phosphotransferase
MGSSASEQYIRDIEDNIANFSVESAVFEGAGDFCRAYTVNGQWIFRFAHNNEGSLALGREAALLPQLATTINVAIPKIAYFGRQRSGLAFVGYPKIHGIELNSQQLSCLEKNEQARCAHDLADFLHELHSFNVATARQSGVIECAYPFARTEDGIVRGSAAELYHEALARLLAYPHLNGESRQYCEWLVQQLLNTPEEREFSASLIHGDLSQDHILFDSAAKRIVGVIDFSDVIISDPLLDYMYLYHSYGESLVESLLSCHHARVLQQAMFRIRLLDGWHKALRLLWTLDHNYQPGIEPRLGELNMNKISSSRK